MKIFRLVVLTMLFGTCQSAFPQQASHPLTKDQVLDLARFKMDNGELAKKIKDLGIDFEPSEDYLEDLRKAGANEVVIQAIREVKAMPLTREQVGELVAGGVPNERAATLIRQRGIDFVADESYLQTLQIAGADETLLAAIREASASLTGELQIRTNANAEVFLDGEGRGRANSHGELVIEARPGAYVLRVALNGKQERDLSVTVVGRKVTNVEAALADSPPKQIENPSPNSTIWYSKATHRDYRVQIVGGLFRADWVNLPAQAASQGAYVRTQCHREGSKWVGSSDVNLLFKLPRGNGTKLCSFTVRFEVDLITAERIMGHSEALSSFDVKSCRIRNTTWGEFTWVPKE